MTYEIKCKHCGRFLANTSKSVDIELKCSNSKCKKIDNYKITFISDVCDVEDHTASCDHEERIKELQIKVADLYDKASLVEPLKVKNAELEEYIAGLEGIINE